MAKDHVLKLNPDGTPFEPFMTWQGNKTARCQGRKKNGELKGYQCLKSAVRETDYCGVHGSGTRKRVRNGKRKPVNTGRPIETGEYSERFQVTDLLSALEQDIIYLGSNVEKELSLSRLATARILALETPVTVVKETLEKHLQGEPDYENLMAAANIIFGYEKYMIRVQKMVLKTVKVAKALADIENSNAGLKALSEFKKYVGIFRIAMQETLEYDHYLAVWTRIQEDLAKVRVNLPKNNPIDA